MQAVEEETLDQTEVKFSEGSACCVVMASNGYPVKYETGFPITVDSGLEGELFYAGAKKDGEKVLSGGGRVLGVTAVAKSLPEAIEKAYQAVEKVHFENAYFRRDIGARALKAEIK